MINMENIILIGDECKKLIKAGSCKGYTHSVFDRVINIETDTIGAIDNMFSVCVRDVPPAPARIIIDSQTSWLSRGFKPGQEFNIICENAPVWQCVKEYNLSAPQIILERLSKVHIPENLRSIKGIPYNDVDALIGRGLGLTPSGDDFLAGVLYSLHFLKCNSLFEPLAKKVKNSLDKTTRLSRHFLKYALAGKWGQTQENVMLALMTDSDKDLNEAVKNQLAIGASSGADEMLGIVEGIRAAFQHRQLTE